nr:hypothetical protein [Desulfonatronospira sp.]
MGANMEGLKRQTMQLIRDLEPEQALDALSGPLRDILSRLEDEQRVRFVLQLLGQGDEDKISSMVHL